MIGNDIVLETEKIREATGIDYMMAKAVRRYHPLGELLVSHGVTKAQAAGREIIMQKHAPQAVIDRYEEVAAFFDVDRIVNDIVSGAKQFGAIGIIIGQQDVTPIEPLDVSTLTRKTFFNVIEPLAMAGSPMFSQDPQKKNFNQAPHVLSVQGTKYHSSRCKVVFNPFKPAQYLQYNTAAYGYTPPSAYEQVLRYLKVLLELDLAANAQAQITGSLVLSQNITKDSYLSRIQEQAAKILRNRISNRKHGDAIILGEDTTLQTIDQQHFGNTFPILKRNALEDVSRASVDGIPMTILTGDQMGRGLSEGDNDAAKEDAYYTKHQHACDAVYQWLDSYICRIAWQDKDWYARFQRTHTSYRNISHTRALMMWLDSFSYEWKPLTPATEQEAIEIADKKLNLCKTALEAGQAAQISQEALTDIYAALIANLNDLNVLPNALYFDVGEEKLRALNAKMDGGGDDGMTDMLEV